MIFKTNLMMFFLVMGFHGMVYGQSATFDSLTEGDVEAIVKEFSANLIHTSVSPPTSLGKNFGVEAAVVGGLSESPKINEVTQRESPGTEVPFIPHAWLYMGVTVPHGVNIELNYIPEVDVQGFEIQHMSAGVKWSITDEFFSSLPFDWAVRTYYSSSEIGFSQTLQDTPLVGVDSKIDVSYKNTMMGVDNIIGFDLMAIEPYLGIGFVRSKADLVGRAEAGIPYSIFGQGGESRSLSEDSVRFIAGLQAKLPMIKLSLEFTNVFGINRVSTKLGFAF